jgi:hypothetical protein
MNLRNCVIGAKTGEAQRTTTFQFVRLNFRDPARAKIYSWDFLQFAKTCLKLENLLALFPGVPRPVGTKLARFSLGLIFVWHQIATEIGTENKDPFASICSIILCLYSTTRLEENRTSVATLGVMKQCHEMHIFAVRCYVKSWFLSLFQGFRKDCNQGS